MTNVYTAPSAELISQTRHLERSFASLGIWRKIYLILQWLWLIAIVATLATAAPADGPILTLTVVLGLYGAITVWTHLAIVNRSPGQLLALALLSLFPFANPVTCLITFAIRATSKQELRDAGEPT